MRKIFILLYSLLCLPAYLFAQGKVVGIEGLKRDSVHRNVVDYAKLQVFYTLDVTLDLRKPSKRVRATTLLQIGRKYSAFLDYNQLRIDSTQNAAFREGATSIDILNRMMAHPLPRFQASVLKNYPKQGIHTVQLEGAEGGFLEYQDDGARQDWLLGKGTKRLGGYDCKQATCYYRGREYVAWYAPAIEIPNGPYMFQGLPGLILEIHDTQNYYHFTIAGMRKVSYKSPVYNNSLKVYKKSRAEVRRIKKNMWSFPGAGGYSKSRRTLPYNPIELE